MKTKKNKKQFCYLGKDARKMASKRKIYIPKIYTNVMTACNKDNKLQAIAMDKQGKNQYFYSKSHKLLSERKKWEKMILFSKQYDNIMNKAIHILKDSNSSGRLKSVAVNILLMNRCNFRIGTKGKATGVSSLSLSDFKKNNTIEFVGKSKVINSCNVDKRLIELYKKYNLNDRATPQDVNKFLSEFGPFSAKNFRTYSANIIFISELKNNKSKIIDTNKLVKESLKYSAKKLHHTYSICKKDYICPYVIESFIKNSKSFDNKESKVILNDILKKYFKL